MWQAWFLYVLIVVVFCSEEVGVEYLLCSLDVLVSVVVKFLSDDEMR